MRAPPCTPQAQGPRRYHGRYRDSPNRYKPGWDCIYIFFVFFWGDNFVVHKTTPSVFQEGGDRLLPPGFPLGPVCVN